MQRHFGMLLVVMCTMAASIVSCKKSDNPLASSTPTFHLVARSDSAYGHSWEEWQAKWWNWCNSMPTHRNPLYDSAGISAGQSGPVWFFGGALAYAYSSSTAGRIERTREGVVPRGTAIFFPVLNEYVDTTGGWPPVDSLDYVLLDGWATGLNSESAEIDGKTIANLSLYRVYTPRFTVTYPDSSITGVPPTNSMATAIGDYLFVDSLSAGKHTIHFTSVSPLLEISVVYNITVP